MNDATYKDPASGEVIERNDIETIAGVESLAWLNLEIDFLMEEYAPLSNLFRGNGATAEAKRKRHRALIGKRIELEEKSKGNRMSQDAIERWANADPDHIAFCDDLDMKGIRYEQLRAKKEALESRRDSRLTELAFVGKQIASRVG